MNSAGVQEPLLNNGQGASKSNIRLLIVEDNRVYRKVCQKIFEAEGIQDLTMAENGQEAYDIVAGEKEKNSVFDIIFMDVSMPVMDGFHCTRLLREIGYTSPIVGMSATVHTKELCLKSGMDDQVLKPFRRASLKETIEKFTTGTKQSAVSVARDGGA